MPAKKTQLSSPEANKPLDPLKTAPESCSPAPQKRMGFLTCILVTIALFFILANVVVFLYLQWKTKLLTKEANRVPTPTPTVTHTPTPTPTPYPLPQGKQSFQLNYGKTATGPKLKSVTVDPYDPKVGAPQTYTVAASHTTPIIGVSLTLTTDNKIATYSMERTKGSDTDGTWEAQITTNDTHLYTYYTLFSIKSASETFEGGLTLRAY